MTMEFTSIKETCIYIKNIEDTREFYNGKLGLPIISVAQGRHIFFKVGNSVLLCFIAEATKAEKNLPPHHGRGNLHFAFESPKNDYGKWRRKIKRLGIEIEN
ncbi:MAG: VOC family protein, partial [Bacteroidetes bacterium]|nr:VOC family protein [Bacteroidota bacterium]